MRKAPIVLASGMFVLTLGGAAPTPAPVFINPVHCSRGTGTTNPPFYDVTAVRNAMPNAPHPLIVRGQYRMTQSSGTLALFEVHYGAKEHLLEIDLRRRPGPVLRNRCVSFRGEFNRADAQEVSISDSRARRIRVHVDTQH